MPDQDKGRLDQLGRGLNLAGARRDEDGNGVLGEHVVQLLGDVLWPTPHRRLERLAPAKPRAVVGTRDADASHLGLHACSQLVTCEAPGQLFSKLQPIIVWSTLEASAKRLSPKSGWTKSSAVDSAWHVSSTHWAADPSAEPIASSGSALLTLCLGLGLSRCHPAKMTQHATSV